MKSSQSPRFETHLAGEQQPVLAQPQRRRHPRPAFHGALRASRAGTRRDDLLGDVDRGLDRVQPGHADQPLVLRRQRQPVDELVELALVLDVEALVAADRAERLARVAGELLRAGRRSRAAASSPRRRPCGRAARRDGRGAASSTGRRRAWRRAATACAPARPGDRRRAPRGPRAARRRGRPPRGRGARSTATSCAATSSSRREHARAIAGGLDERHRGAHDAVPDLEVHGIELAHVLVAPDPRRGGRERRVGEVELEPQARRRAHDVTAAPATSVVVIAPMSGSGSASSRRAVEHLPAEVADARERRCRRGRRSAGARSARPGPIAADRAQHRVARGTRPAPRVERRAVAWPCGAAPFGPQPMITRSLQHAVTTPS